MMLGKGGPAGVGWVRYFYLTQASCSSRRHMDDPALVWTTGAPLAHGWRHFEEMLMPGEIDLRTMRRLREQRLQLPPQVCLDDSFQAMGARAIERVVSDHDLQGRAASPQRVRQPRQLRDARRCAQVCAAGVA